MLYKIKMLLPILFSIILISCNGGPMSEQKIQLPSIKDVPVSKWQSLSQKKIFFGHQSVGFNIIDGIKDVMKENPQIKLNILETNNPSDFEGPIFAHSRVGKNVDPKSKLDDFSSIMDKGLGNTADIAFMKFCYVDVNAHTNVKNLFNEYKAEMSKLQTKYPKTSFIHLSVPLKTTKTTFKTWLKELMGKDIWEYSENIKRYEINELLKKEYGESGFFFDLAKIQSTFPDGKESTFKQNEKTYRSLVPDYTYDGGHLNETGRKKVAEQLLILLVNLA